ncbi:hypothetical protein [Mucilaginibacter celer]|nr:hypothetical protein [Mucilaginibacter celer]
MKRLTARHYFTIKNLLFLFFAICLIIIVYSCKKENRTNKNTDIVSPAVLKAKNWYENAYPSVSKTSTLSTIGNPDLSQLVNPDWSQSKNYTRYDDDVIELPIDKDDRLNFDLSNNAGLIYNNKYSRSWFLLLNKFDRYSAYIMTIIADSAYIKSKPDGLKLNSYNKHDADFTGIVIYSTPQGKYVNGWFYKNGVISGYLPPGQTSETEGDPTVQNIKTNTVTTVRTCQDFIQKTYYNGQLVATTVIATYCTTTTIDDESGNGSSGVGGNLGGGGGGGGGGSSTTNPPNTPQCNIPYNNDAVKTVKINSLQTQKVAPIDDGGFPPPANPIPCPPPAVVNLPPVTTIVTNNVTNPCLKKMVDATIISGVNTQINSLIKDVFGGTEKLNLKFVDNVSLASGTEGHTEMNGGFDSFGNLNIEIQLNKNELPGYSQQFVATVIMHEALHAYLQAKGVDPKNQHENIIIDYVTKMSASLMQMFPGLSSNDAKNLSLGGLDQTTTFLYTVARDMKLSGDYAATQLAYSVGSLGSRCK